jgi:hypothetical protein
MEGETKEHRKMFGDHNRPMRHLFGNINGKGCRN